MGVVVFSVKVIAEGNTSVDETDLRNEVEKLVGNAVGPVLASFSSVGDEDSLDQGEQKTVEGNRAALARQHEQGDDEAPEVILSPQPDAEILAGAPEVGDEDVVYQQKAADPNPEVLPEGEDTPVADPEDAAATDAPEPESAESTDEPAFGEPVDDDAPVEDPELDSEDDES